MTLRMTLGCAALVCSTQLFSDLAHADEDDGADLRERAAHAVRWRHRHHPGASGVVPVRLLGLNDFHGRLSEGLLVGGRPVGGAAVLASYLKSAAADFEGRSLIVHAGDAVGASPPDSALLQDEPTMQFFNLLANPYCRGSARRAPRCKRSRTAPPSASSISSSIATAATSCRRRRAS